MIDFFKKLWNDESAISATEYGVLAAVIAAALIIALGTMRTKIENVFNQAGGSIDNAANAGGSSGSSGS